MIRHPKINSVNADTLVIEDTYEAPCHKFIINQQVSLVVDLGAHPIS